MKCISVHNELISHKVFMCLFRVGVIIRSCSIAIKCDASLSSFIKRSARLTLPAIW